MSLIAIKLVRKIWGVSVALVGGSFSPSRFLGLNSSQRQAGMVVAPPELYTEQTNFSMGRSSSGSSPSTSSWLVSTPSPRSWKTETTGSSLGKDRCDVIQLFFEMPTTFPPQSAPVKLLKPINPFPVKKLSLVNAPSHP